jgi:hypothetical protein
MAEAMTMMRSWKKLWLFLALMMVLAGCGGSSPSRGGSFPGGAEAKGPAKSGSGFDAEGDSAPAPAQAQPAFGGAPTTATTSPNAPPPSASGGSVAREESRSSATKDSAKPSEPAPESRPGLGTEWGESRTSRVHDVSFVRDSSRPFALATLHYNDRRGVDALANLHSQRSARSLTTGGGAVTVSIRDANGNPLEAVHVSDRTFVIGAAGQRYSIVLTNNTSHRFEAVATVDGLDVVNGKAGNFDNRGYVLLPFATLEIEGFRQSSAAVAAFRFAAVADSYAAQTGSARNVGVIGVALFSERGDAFIPESDTRLRDSASPFPADPRFAQPPRR